MEKEVFLPAEVKEKVNEACLNLLPKKSKAHYDKEFGEFNEWSNSGGIIGMNEDVLLAYFLNVQKKSAASSMWKKYSMLKATLKVYKNIDISKYGKLITFLKNESRSHKPKKAKILERYHIEKFLREARDSDYLMMNVPIALLMGVSGACRCIELVNLNLRDIQDKELYLHISIPDTKTNVSRSFTVIAEGFPVDTLGLYRKYVSLRPEHTPHGRLFINYKNGKCTIQPVGINTLSKIPSKVASYLQLPDAESYTGHSLRHSFATLLVNAEGDILALKRHGGWKSSIVAEGYIEDSITSKIGIAKKIQEEAQVEKPSPVNISLPTISCTKTSSDIAVNQSNKNVLLSINVNINLNNK